MNLLNWGQDRLFPGRGLLALFEKIPSKIENLALWSNMANRAILKAFLQDIL